MVYLKYTWPQKLWVAGLACLLILGQTANAAAHSVQAILEVINDSDQPLCGVRTAFAANYYTDGNLEPNHLSEGETIPPGQTYSLPLPPGKYILHLVNCEQKVVYLEYDVAIANRYELHFTGKEDRCEALFEEGAAATRFTLYPEAQQALEAALDCYQADQRTTGAGNVLNYLGELYLVQARYPEALKAYEQAVVIFEQADNWVGQGHTLIHIGQLYLAQEQAQETLRMYEQALAIFRQRGSRAGEAETLKQMSDLYLAQRRYEEVTRALEQLPIIHHELGSFYQEGMALSHLGEFYTAQYRYEQALTVLEQALAIQEEIKDEIETTRTLIRLGRTYYGLGRPQTAISTYKQAWDIIKSWGGFPIWEGTIQTGLGQTYLSQGRYEEALTALQLALEFHRQVSNQVEAGATFYSIGLIYANQGRYAEALAAYEQALAIQQKVVKSPNNGLALKQTGDYSVITGWNSFWLDPTDLLITDRSGEALTLGQIGEVYHRQGRTDEALTILKQALAIQRQLGRQAEAGITLTSIGAVYADQGDYEAALTAYQQALTEAHAAAQPGQEGVAQYRVGQLYFLEKHYEQAQAAFQAALVRLRQVNNRPEEGRVLINLGLLYSVQRQYSQALDYLAQGLTILREVGDQEGIGLALSYQGQIYEAQDRHGQAITAYQQALEIVESIRATAGSEQGRASFIAQYALLYEKTVRLLIRQDQAQAAFFVTERGRARAFIDSLATGQLQLNDNVAADLLARQQTLAMEQEALKQQLGQAYLRKASNETVVALKTQLATAEQAHQEALAAIAARSDQLAALTPGRSSQTLLDVAGVQQRLEAGTALLSFHILEKQTLAFLITPDHFEVVELPVSREQLTNQVSRLRDLLAFKQPEATQAAAQELYQALIPNFQSLLPTLPSRLLIVPHGPLHYLPFVALYDSTQAKYLVEQYELVMLPSASVLPFITADRQPHSTDLTALVVGNPTPGDLTADLLAGADPVELPPLPYAQKEAEAIAALYNIEPLFGADATESAVRRQAEQAGMVHLAAHGYYNPAAPLNSLIALTPDSHQSPATQDGWLTVGEVYGLNLKQADLVVLSACQTQLGELSAGDELVGLTRAFIFAGTPSVMASLWNVDDAATAHLMEKFYIHLRAGMSKASALRQAQLDTLADFPDPYYWAAFTLSGDGGPVSQTATPQIIQPDAEPQPNWPWLAAGIGVLVLVTIGGLLWRRYRV
ncbi:MAG: CHAT domain-containing protein [Anaerolineales bacterium]|nr:CHAT domain-containing protein [Anaerolineales bacterium]